ncbi:class I SAM-dependent DNA methyltransferase [Aestuariibius sp. 2305UL40-4]|uniref:class I SAM-dependent DNA methyltransferase n=1 Tax=Aestuariibius violaceus TaxID=3234132 RepID=UPI00345E44CC
MSRDRETLAVYDAKATEYAATFDAKPSTALANFIAAMPRDAHVLDLGCGPGTSARTMAEAGLTVTATDASPEMVALASRVPGITVREEDFDALTGTDLYDSVWASFSLLHAPRAAFPRHLAAIATALKPGGRLHLGLKTGTGEGRDALGRFYTYYTPSELRDLLQAAGFTLLETTEGRERGLAGSVDPYILIAAHA